MPASLPPPHVEAVDRWRVVRDDLLPGGTKMRAMLAGVPLSGKGVRA